MWPLNGIDAGGRKLSLVDKSLKINWGLLLLLCMIAGLGFAMLYSIAGQSIEPWAYPQIIRFAAGMVILLITALVDIHLWLKLAYPIYALALILLVSVEFFGVSGISAERWIRIGPLQIQPAEIMKVAMVLALARYFHGISLEQVSRPLYLIPSVLLIAAPVAFILNQPDLGTAVLLLLGGAGMLFLAGLSWRVFALSGMVSLLALPLAWQSIYEYQRERILNFLDPTQDPLGAGYNIIQSKIALGSGGVFGKGFGNGSQAKLDFLPERHTDFIFTALGEELGFVGACLLIGMYVLVLGYAVSFAFASRNHFGRLLAIGIGLQLFLYVATNTAMVVGLVPVVGVPIPLVSYGGTAMITLMFGFGLLMSVHIHRNVYIPRATP